MHDLVVQGKVLYWGTSEWSAAQLTEAFSICDRLNLHAPVTEQPQYNLLHRTRVEKEYAPLYKTRGLGATIWSPLASGLLTGKYNDGIPADSRITTPGLEWLRDLLLDESAPKKIAAIKKFAAIAASLDTTLPRLGVAWCLKNPHVSTVILGASRPEQLVENLGALDVVPRLTPAILKKIDAISGPVAA
jgi:aryl-alcohol dehydrogenase-like predicted oxidoreductase